jgi:hypothetical protein
MELRKGNIRFIESERNLKKGRMESTDCLVTGYLRTFINF